MKKVICYYIVSVISTVTTLLVHFKRQAQKISRLKKVTERKNDRRKSNERTIIIHSIAGLI